MIYMWSFFHAKANNLVVSDIVYGHLHVGLVRVLRQVQPVEACMSSWEISHGVRIAIVRGLFNGKFSFLTPSRLKGTEATQGNAAASCAELQDSSQLFLVVGVHYFPEAMEGHARKHRIEAAVIRVLLPIVYIND